MLNLALLLLFAAPPTETLVGKVVAVTDGDTIKILVGTDQVKVRLAGIDAPESKQPFGTRAKQALSEKIFGQEVPVEAQGKDRYGRTLGTIFVGTRNINVEMVQEGMAWQFVKYDKSKSLAEAEAAARKAKRGLWADPNPVAPWEWRVEKKKAGASN
jgi:endonuclease YncB( thermonuclease family)